MTFTRLILTNFYCSDCSFGPFVVFLYILMFNNHRSVITIVCCKQQAQIYQANHPMMSTVFAAV